MRPFIRFLCVFSMALPALAPTLLQAKIEPYDLFQPKPLDQVLQHFDLVAKKLRNPAARALKKSYDLYEAKLFVKAITAAKPVLDNPLFSDYAHWITASAFEEEAQVLADSGRPKLAAAAAKQALEHFQIIRTGNPYSPFFKQALKEVGQAKILVGYGFSPTRESVHQFEDGLEILSSFGGGISAITPEQTVAFAKGCAKFKDDLCMPWLFRLVEKLGRDTTEFRTVAKLLPAVVEHAKPTPNAPHSTQTYHAPDLDSAAFDDAMSSCLASHWAEAVVKFRKFMDEFPKSILRFRARYWLARCDAEQLRKDEAMKEWRSVQNESSLSYYGMLSAFASKDALAAPVTEDFPLAAERDPAMSASDTYHLKRAETLLAENADDLAGMELKEIRPHPSLSSPFIAYLAGLNYRAQNYPSLMVVLTELIQRTYPSISSEIGVKMIFPITQLDRIKRYAGENAVDPILVLSLIKQESAFDIHAISSSGAAGLMQLMYFTAIETVPGISHTDLLEPEHNIKAGTRYLGQLLTRYNGNIVLSLAAYNAGPNAVDRWVKEAAKQKYGMLEFIEAIPYRETRDYVSSIIRNYFWYSHLLGDAGPHSLSFFWKSHGELSEEIGGPDIPVLAASPLPQPSAAPSPTPSSSISGSPSGPSPAPSSTSSPSSTPSSSPTTS